VGVFGSRTFTHPRDRILTSRAHSRLRKGRSYELILARGFYTCAHEAHIFGCVAVASMPSKLVTTPIDGSADHTVNGVRTVGATGAGEEEN